MSALHYPKHDAQALGQDYINHVMAMTREGLHSKSDIAIQLAWRDAELRRLHQQELALMQWIEKTNWVQVDAQPSELGRHRADAIQMRVARLHAANLDCVEHFNAVKAERDELLKALKQIMDNACPLTGNPSHAELVEHWEYEKTQGRGEADDQLFALAAIAKATGGAA